MIDAVQRRLPAIQDGRLTLSALRPWAAEYDELSDGEQYTAEEFIDWLRRQDAAATSDLAREHMTAAALRRHAKVS